MVSAAVLFLHILFVPLNYSCTIMDPYNPPDTQWLSLYFLFPSFSPPPPPKKRHTCSHAHTHSFSVLPGVLLLTVGFIRPVWCRHGWCILVCNDSHWPIVHGNNEKTPTTVNWDVILLRALFVLLLGNELITLDNITVSDYDHMTHNLEL